MAHLQKTHCCGIRELDGVQGCTALQAAIDAANDWFAGEVRNGAYIFFSTTSGHKIGHNLAVFIEEHGLGKVIQTKPNRNPNSGNLLTMWVWTVDKKNFKAFWNKFGEKEEDEAVGDYEF